MSREEIPALAICPGEPAGIGPDILLSLCQQPLATRMVCCADPEMLYKRATELAVPLHLRQIRPGDIIAPHHPGTLNIWPIVAPSPVRPGKLSASNASYVLECLDCAIDGTSNAFVDAIVTGPVHKGTINDAGFKFFGHTEYIADKLGSSRPVMMLASGNLRVALVTTHLALREIPAAINIDNVTHAIRIVAEALRERFGIERPTIAVCGLNPHAGEGGHFGTEEASIIRPAMDAAASNDVELLGPLPADTAFGTDTRERVDAYITMYHDQGLPVIKALDFGAIVNLTLGIPIIRTSVDHGTAIDLAGTGKAKADSLLAAINLAQRLATTK